MYVDDILIVHSLTQTNAKEILDEFINFSPNIDFTLEEEQNNILNFLDIKINRCNVKSELKAKIEELESNSMINNIRGINDFKKAYQPRTIKVKDEKGDLVADSHNIMTRWKNYFSQLLNVHGAKDVRQEEIHTQNH